MNWIELAAKSLDNLTQSANQTAAACESMGEVVNTVAVEVHARTAEVRKTVDEAHGHVATKLDDLIYNMKQLAEQGNSTAQSLLSVIDGVKNGIIPTLDAINSFGDALIVIDGKLR